MNSTTARLRGAALAALLPGIVFSAAAPASPATKEEVIELSPFVVATQTDTGYAATNTLEGSRLNTALRDTPAAISIFTKDLLDDLGATTMEEILRYDLSAEVSFGDSEAGGTGNQASNFAEGFSFRARGLGASFSTDGFRTAGEPNTYNVERVGSTRGPNAILFGTGSAGGNLNFRTRAPGLTKNLTAFDFKVASESTKRAAVDVNRVLLKDRLALRVMSVWDRKGSPQPHQYTDFQGITLAATYRFRRDTDLTVSYQHDKTEGVAGRDWNHVDNLSRFITQRNSGAIRWNPTLERYENANGTVLNATAAGTGNVNLRNVLVYGPDLSVAPLLWEGASATVNRVTLATNASVFNALTAPIVHEGFERFGAVTSTGPAEFAAVTYDSLSAIFNHRWTKNVYMELAYNHSKRATDSMIGQNPQLRADLNYRLPNGTLNPYFLENGYYFSESNLLRLKRTNDNDTLRASLSYEKDLGQRWGFHRFAVMGERYINQESRLRTHEAWANRPFGGFPEDAANRVTRRRYIKIGGPSVDYTGGYQPGNPANLEKFTSSFPAVGAITTTWVPRNALDFDDEITTDSLMAVMQNYFFSRRLVTTVGVRDDSITAEGPRVVRDATTGFWRFATSGDKAAFAPIGKDWFSSETVSGLRKSIGGVFHATGHFSLTANYSSGVELGDRNRTILPNEETPPPVNGQGYDYGLAFSFLENRISGSIKAYQTESKGERTQAGEQVFVQPNNDVMTSYDYYYRQAGLTPSAALTTAYLSTADAYLGDRKSNGYEFELFANPTRNWTLRAGYAYTDRTTTNVYNEGVPWWAGRVAIWKELDQAYVTRTGRPSINTQTLYDRTQAFGTVTVGQRIAQSDTELARLRLEDQQSYGNRPHKANLWTRYSFSSGRLKGLAVGGGWRYQSGNVAGVQVSTERQLIGNARSLGDLFLQYKTKGLAGIWPNSARVTYQLNITNVLDNRTITATKLDIDSVSNVVFVRRGFREDPRAFAFSLRTDF